MSKERNTSSSHEAFDAKNLEALRNEQNEALRENLERNVEHKSKDTIEQARNEALEQAGAIEKQQTKAKEKSPAERRGPLSKQERDKSFNSTMNEVQSQMSPSSRQFSKFIHNKAVERASDAIGGTIARPNAILSGSVFAFVLTLIIYVIARYNGYPLSGAETIAAFAVGWVLGMVFDYFKALIGGKAN